MEREPSSPLPVFITLSASSHLYHVKKEIKMEREKVRKGG